MYKLISFIFLLFMAAGIQTQPAKIIAQGTDRLDSLILAENYTLAKRELSQQLDYIQRRSAPDSLAKYPYYIGKVYEKFQGKEKAVQLLEKFVIEIERKIKNPAQQVDLFTQTASYFEHIRNYEKSLKYHQKALEIAESDHPDSLLLAKVLYNLALTHNRRGEYHKGKKFAEKSLYAYKTSKKSTPEDMYFAYSVLGTAHYYSAKIDSSIYYYELAASYAAKDTISALNRFYRPSLIANNTSVLYLMLGKTQKAIEQMQFAIDYNQKYIENGEDAFKVQESKKWQINYLENLAGIYEGRGDYKTQLELLQYVLKKRKNHSETSELELGTIHALNGTAHLKQFNYREADKHFSKALERLINQEGNLEWLATIYDGLGHISWKQNDLKIAEQWFLKAKAIYEQMNPEEMDKSNIEFFNELAFFYADSGENEKAVATAKETLAYLQKNNQHEMLPVLLQTYYLGEIYYKTGKIEQAKSLADNTIQSLEKLIQKTDNSYDSIVLSFKKPPVLLLQIKSEYDLNSTKDSVFLKKLLTKNLDIIHIINQHKRFLGNTENIQVLMANHREVYDFAKKLLIDLYNLTFDAKYLYDIIDLHENSVYNRIRSQLNKIEAFEVHLVPTQVTRREAYLKSMLQQGLNTDSVALFVQTQNDWLFFLDSLKINHPEYYQLKFDDPKIRVKNVQKQLKSDQTIIRYFYIQNDLYASVINGDFISLQPLGQPKIVQNLENVQDYNQKEEVVLQSLFRLYQQLWQPLEKQIQTKNVIIIPDKELYNLSFDALTKEAVTTYTALRTNCLLNNYHISYNFSSHLVNAEKNSNPPHLNFLAVAPGFSKKSKQMYEQGVEDSANLDYGYLDMLPQPNMIKLAKKTALDFKGSYFIEENASKNNFLMNATDNKIIHLGTHTHFNNHSPEFSSLVFAKEKQAKTRNENYLYAYQIYNHALNADLAVLSACETGKNTENPGEGMISLAHAFTSAGCKSIFTSLWQTDEKNSTYIIDKFYGYLAQGKQKSQALQLAKMDYLTTFSGEQLSPAYWSGWIVMGDNSAVNLASTNPFIKYSRMVVLVSVFLILGFQFYRKRNRNKSAKNAIS
ncbi:MAG: CHAT domain-containing protein [Flavobacteriaceae bacterium]|nr:CHAT domain-containing protein [Flavobacteriaceae bacterium]